jgi:hypothetical protein
MRFALKVDVDDMSDVKNLVKFANFHADLGIGDNLFSDSNSSKAIKKFVECPLNDMVSVSAIVELNHLPILIAKLVPEDRNKVAMAYARFFIESRITIRNVGNLQFIVGLTKFLVTEGGGTSVFFGLVHLIDGGKISNTLRILQELINVMEAATVEAYVKSMLPIGFAAMKLLSDSNIDNSREVIRFIDTFGKTGLNRSPRNVIILYTETCKVLESLNIMENASELATIAMTTWKELSDETIKAGLFRFMLQFVVSSRSVPLCFASEICQFVSELPNGLESIRALISCSSLFWRMDERYRKSSDVQLYLSKASKVAMSLRVDITECLHGLYLVLNFAVYWLLQKVKLRKIWITTLIEVISNIHKEIELKKGLLDTVLRHDVRVIFINSMSLIEEQTLLADLGEEEEGEEEEDIINEGS